MERPGTVVIVGVGLIGGSIGRAIRTRNAADRVVGVDLDPAQLQLAADRGVIDVGTANLEQAVAGAAIVVVCAPVTATVPLVLAASRAAPESVLITDVGSTKARIVAAVEADPRASACFVGSHPMAGSERQGVAHARADLFANRTIALTPTPRTVPDRLDRARRFWQSLGARLVELDPVEHDRRLALTSHLPHAVAAALAATVPPEFLPLAAGAYRDGTRVAGAEANLWAGIFLDNRQPLLDALDGFDAQIQAFRAALAAGDGTGLVSWWHQGQLRRSRFIEGGQRDEEPPGTP